MPVQLKPLCLLVAFGCGSGRGDVGLSSQSSDAETGHSLDLPMPMVELGAERWCWADTNMGGSDRLRMLGFWLDEGLCARVSASSGPLEEPLPNQDVGFPDPMWTVVSAGVVETDSLAACSSEPYDAELASTLEIRGRVAWSSEPQLLPCTIDELDVQLEVEFGMTGEQRVFDLTGSNLAVSDGTEPCGAFSDC